MRIHSPEIIVIEGIANEVSHTEWRAYAPAAETLERGIDIARTAVIRMKEAKTVEEWIEGRRIAQRAMEELKRAKIQADAILFEQRKARLRGIASPQEPVAILYEHINYEGRSLALGPGYLKDMSKNIVEGKDFNDVVSSHKILPDHVVTAYEDINYGGASVNLTGNVPDYTKDPILKDWNDAVSSMRVNGPVVTPTIPIPGETLWQKIVDPLQTVAKNVVDAAKITVDVINDVISKAKDLVSKTKKAKLERDKASAQMEEIRALAPAVKTPALRAEISKLEAEFGRLNSETGSAITETNRLSNETSGSIKEETIEGIGSPFLPLLALIPLIIKAIVVVVGLVAAWGIFSSNAKAKTEEAKRDAATTEVSKTIINENTERRELAFTETEKIDTEIDGLEEQRDALITEGKTKEAEAVCSQITALEDKRSALIAPFLTPVKPAEVLLPTVKPPTEEKTALEKWTGIKPSYIGMGVVLIVGVMLLPHIIPLIKGAIPKPGKE